jgi:hypothetical protein
MDAKLMETTGALYGALGDKLGNSIDPSFVTPLVVYLCSEACDSTHGIYSSTLGRYARVFLSMGEGWVGPRMEAPRAEDMAAHWAAICEKKGAQELGSLMDEFRMVAGQLTGA